MRKTFKNQTYELDKTPIKSRRHSQEWQARIVQIISKTQINTWSRKTIWEDTKRIRSSNVPNPLHFSWWHTKYQDKKCLSSKETRHRDKISIEDNKCSKAYRIAPPRFVHYLWSYIWIQNAHNGIITLHIYYSNTSHVQEKQ